MSVLQTERGTITVPAATLAALVTRSVESVPQVRVRRRRRLDVHVANGHAAVALELAAGYGTILPAVAREVQARVKDALETMCGVTVDAVDVAIEEIE